MDSDVESGIPGNGYPNKGEASGTPYTHPQYMPNAFFRCDLGVVVLSKPIHKAQYGALPTQNALDALATQRGTQNVTCSAVGYGLQMSFPNAASWKENNVRVRTVAEPHLLRRLGRPELHCQLERRGRRDVLRG